MSDKEKKKLGEILQQYEMISDEQLSSALRYQKMKNKRLGEVLIELGFVKQDQINWILSKQLDIPYVQIEPEQLDCTLLMDFPKNLIKNYILIPLIEIENKVIIVMTDPTDEEAIQRLRNTYQKDIDIVFASYQNITEMIKYLEKEHPEMWQ